MILESLQTISIIGGMDAECMIVAKPFVKWAGGKQALAKSLIVKFPNEFETYYEPFVGGGAVFFALNHVSSIISDENRWLIDTYTAVRDCWDEVSERLDGMINTKAEFLRVRSTNPWSLDLVGRAAQFIYLNKTCFRGLFRVNRKGRFNVPYGNYNRRYYSYSNLQAVSDVLQKTEFRCGDFEFGIDGINEDDFVYFDPPYYKLGGYSDFNRYTSRQFIEKDHFRLAALCRELDNRGVKWAMSNSNTKFIKSLYAGFHIHTISSRREINLNSNDRNIKELLILNY